MHIVLAPDSYKESLTATEACMAMANGIYKVLPKAIIQQIPMADGGEGTTDALTHAKKGIFVEMMTTDPLGRPIPARYGLIDQGNTAVIELAAASGIHLVSPNERNPMLTTTYGTGVMIKHAIENKVKKIVLGIGGSATNDGGCGLAAALGIRFLDANGLEISPNGGQLNKIHHIDSTNNIVKQHNIEIEVACDVTNPLCGSNGASATFGPQKGANPEMVTKLDQNLKHLAGVVTQTFGSNVSEVPGAGAAGGTGFGLMSFFNATLKSGIALTITYSGLEEAVRNADLVLTGEGGLDAQTQFGKTPFGVAQVAKKYGVPVIAFGGRVSAHDTLYTSGFDAVFSIMQGVSTLADALKNGAENLSTTVENVLRAMLVLNNINKI